MSMYNKIFTKILDSSIWLEPTTTRIVWITMIAAMDENGFCQFAAVGNLAGRARVTAEEARKAVEILESPDPESSDDDNEGRRIERVPGGWIVLNAPKYRAIVTRVNAQERTKERVRRFREKNKPVTAGNAHVTQGNAPVTPCNDPVTPSEAETNTEVQKPSRAKAARATKTAIADERHTAFKEAIGRYWVSKNPGIEMPWGPAEGKQLGMFLREAPHITLDQFTVFLRNRYKSDVNHGDRPCQWLKWVASYGPGPVDRFKNTAQEGNNGTNHRSPAKERVDNNRLAIAAALAKRGIHGPWDTPQPDSQAVSEPRHDGDAGGIHGRSGASSPEILPPEGRGRDSGTPR
jgi:hypothetical protein